MKGRNSNLIQLRNEYLIKRYYYWYDIMRKRHDDVLDTLMHEEIFLDRDYILHLRQQNIHLYKQLKAAKPNAKQLETFSFTRHPQYSNGNLFAVVEN